MVTLEEFWTTVLVGVILVLPVVMLFIVPRNRTPTSAIAWLLVIAVLPLIGFLLFLLMGSPKLPDHRRGQQAMIDAMVRERVAEARREGPVGFLDPELRPAHQDLAQLTERLGGLPAVGGNHVEIVTGYQDGFQRIARDIDAAQRFVHMEYYILVSDEATDVVWRALERAVERGVRVRVLFDHLGSRAYAGHAAALERMNRAKIPWRPMLPFQPIRGRWARPDLRNHRKIVVLDGIIAWSGSQNLIADDYASARYRREGVAFQELIVRSEGPVAVELDAIFRTDWHAETGEMLETETAPPTGVGTASGQVLPSGPAHPYENNLRVFNALVHAARRRLTLTNAYFVPDESLLQAITVAAQRGVDVRLITDESGDHGILRYAQRSYYDDLMAAGVRVFLHPGPHILHSKTLTVDDDLAVVGSSNLDMRSFHLNLEVSVLFYDAAVCARVQAAEDVYLSQCRELTLAEWRSRPRLRQALESMARLTAAVQ